MSNYEKLLKSLNNDLNDALEANEGEIFDSLKESIQLWSVIQLLLPYREAREFFMECLDELSEKSKGQIKNEGYQQALRLAYFN